MNLLNVVVPGLFVVWGLFMAGTVLVCVVLKLTPNAGASSLSAPVCGPSRAQVWTRPVLEMQHAPPEPITAPVRPEPAPVVDKARKRCEDANEELKGREVVQPVPVEPYLVENWPVRKPQSPIERN